MDLLLQRTQPRSSSSCASTEPPPVSPVSRLPSATAGIALGLCGAGSILSELHQLWSGPADGGTLILTLTAAAAWLPFSLSRLCCRRVLAAEMRMPSQISSYGAWQMVWQFLSLRLVFLASPTAARVLVFLGQALQLGLRVWFRLLAHPHGARALLEPSHGQRGGLGCRGYRRRPARRLQRGLLRAGAQPAACARAATGLPVPTTPGSAALAQDTPNPRHT